MKRIVLTSVIAGALALGSHTAPQAAGARRERASRSPRTSRRFFSEPVRTATGPARSRRCRCCQLRRRASVGALDQDDRVERRQMPPWHVDTNVGHPQVQGRSVAERSGDRDDHRVGRRRARRAAIPPTCRRRAQFDDSDRWHIGKPDLIVVDAERVRGQARGRRTGGASSSPTPGLTEDRYIKAVEAKPSPARAPRRPSRRRIARLRRRTPTAAARSSNTPSARTATSFRTDPAS